MDYVRTFTREFDIGEPVELVVENRAGTVSVRGEETKRARIEVVAHLWAETDDEADDQAELVSRGIKQEGKRILVRAPALLQPHPFLFFARSPRIDYAITLPRRCEANVTSRSGRVEVESIAGPLEVNARSGRVGAREIGGDTRLISRSGSVQAEAIGGSLLAESRSGSVRVSQCRGDARVQARSGSVQAEEIGGKLEVQTRSGSTGIVDVGGELRVSAMSGSVRYEGAVRGSFDIDVMSGSAKLALDADSVFFLDAESTNGSVRSDLPVRNTSSGPPKDAPTVRIRARSGSIVLATR
jgi:DUF4097 and DUF4098 domain-containing protein YvlB